jgi:arylsulfatase A-like enzyme
MNLAVRIVAVLIVCTACDDEGRQLVPDGTGSAVGSLREAARAPETPRNPNVIVVLTDDQGYADLGVQGVVEDIATPNLDDLARHGVRMTHGYVTAPQCVPSRAGLMSGRYQNRFGIEQNGDAPLLPEEVTVAERLQEAGYVTGMAGKWHLGVNEKSAARFKKMDRQAFGPGNQGFDEYFSGNEYSYSASHLPDGSSLDAAPQPVTTDAFRVDVKSQWAASFIDRHAEDRFFLYVSYFAPHVPTEAPDYYLRRFSGVGEEERRFALAMLSAIDDGVGRMTTMLKKHDIESNTVIFFLSDNGAPTHGASNGSRNDPLVGGKGMLLDGGLRVPFLVSWKGTLPEGRVYDRPVISLDVAATVVALAGLPFDERLDGVDLMPFLTGRDPEDPHEALYWRWGRQAAVRAGRWKLIWLGERLQLLFDEEGHEGETLNVIEEHPRVARELTEKLKAWSESLSPPGLPANDSGDVRFRAYERHGILETPEQREIERLRRENERLEKRLSEAEKALEARK